MQASAGEVFIYCCDPGLQAGLCRTSVKFERSSVFCQGLFDLNTNLQIIFILIINSQDDDDDVDLAMK